MSMSYTVSPVDLTAITLNEADPVRSVLQNVAIILCTAAGTVPLGRELGLPGDIVDRPIPAVKAMMIAAVREAVEQWEPRAEVTAVTIREDPSVPGRLVPEVEVNIIDQKS